MIQFTAYSVLVDQLSSETYSINFFVDSSMYEKIKELIEVHNQENKSCEVSVKIGKQPKEK